jgi:hypothetical protein
MRIRADVEDIQTTRTEKLLAVLLTAFLLLGGIWTYQKIDDVVRRHVSVPSFAAPGPASQRLQEAQTRAERASAQRQRALENLELRREAYRTALDAGQLAVALRRQYDAAQREFAAAAREVIDAQQDVSAARPAAEAEQAAAAERVANAYHRQQRDSFLVRLGFIALWITGAYGLLVWGRRRASRWFPLAASVIAAATIMAFVLGADYLTDYIEPFEWGVAGIAALGIVATLLVYWGLQRYLIRRLPQRRVKRHQCPFCGYPAGACPHCEGCGREVVAPCTRCEAPRRVGTPYCGVCGATAGAVASTTGASLG